VAAIDGTTDAITALVDSADLPETVEVLGPVDLPDGQRAPAGSGEDGLSGDVQRLLIRVPRSTGAALARALSTAQASRSAKKLGAGVRIQIDPIRIG
jgi:primosomal protein N' (replication factor Y)